MSGVPPFLRRSAQVELLGWIAAREKAAERWRSYAAVFTEARKMGISEDALAALAQDLGAPLPEPHPEQ
jgi:hypothetical protein